MIALITGFAALPGKVNPSAVIAHRLNDSEISGLKVVGVEVPENFYELPNIARSLVIKFDPAVVLSMAWDNIPLVKVEKVALNVMYSLLDGEEVSDHFGHKPMGEEIVRGGPVAYWSTIPAEAIVEAERGEGIAATVSYLAHTHCFNTLLYSFLHVVNSAGKRTLVGHLYVPPIPEMLMRGGTRWDLERELDALKTALTTCALELQGKD